MASSTILSSSQAEGKKPENQDEVGLVEVDGAIGLYKNRAFQPLTNFGISCRGFVSSGKSVEGYLIEVVPANCQCLDSSESQCSTYYLTLREMSSQLSILQKIPGQGIWTAPSRDQYLPSYFKEVCDRYLQSAEAKELKPVKRLGYQQGCDPPFWILGRNLQVKVVEGEAIQVSEADSPCCILDGLLKVSTVSIEGNIDRGEALKELLLTQETFFKDNFMSSLMLLGCVILGTHYEHAVGAKKKVPIAMAFGHPNTAKSTALECALSVLGRGEMPLGDTTHARLIQELSSHSLPLMWDDVSNLSQLESIALMCYNKTGRKTMRKADNIVTIPILTVNPSEIAKKKISKEKAQRIFSRTLIVPFKEVEVKDSLIDRLKQKEKLDQRMANSIKSCGVILGLFDIFNGMLDDPSATEIQNILPRDMDLRSQENYLMLLYTVSKLLEVLELKNTYFPQFGPWLEDVVLPVYNNLFQEDNSSEILDACTPKEEQYTIIVELLEKVAKEPKEASSFFLPDMVPRGCHCGACIAFNVPKACQYVGKPGAGTQARLRKWVRESDRGCTGRNLNVMVGGKTKCITGCHVKKELFPSDLIDRVKEAFVKEKGTAAPKGTAIEPRISPVQGISRERGCSKDTADTIEVEGTEIEHQSIPECSNDAAASIELKGTEIEHQSIPECSNDAAASIELEGTEIEHQSIPECSNDAAASIELEDTNKHSSLCVNATSGCSTKDSMEREELEQHKRKLFRKRGAASLKDNLHPGELTGKRTRKKKGI